MHNLEEIRTRTFTGCGTKLEQRTDGLKFICIKKRMDLPCGCLIPKEPQNIQNKQPLTCGIFFGGVIEEVTIDVGSDNEVSCSVVVYDSTDIPKLV